MRMKKINFYIVTTSLLMSLLVGCNIGYQYDIESGIDENTSDSSSGGSTDLSEIDVSMWEYAAIFPGLVDTTKEVRVRDYALELDMTKRYVSATSLGVNQVPDPYYSTGLYAGAGEPVTIEVDGTLGLSVLIGSHVRDMTNFLNTNGSFVERYPLISMTKALFPGKNIVKNPFGGTIWIRKDGQTGQDKIQLRVSGAYQSSDYVRGKTDAAEWTTKINATTVPWIELRGEHIVFSVPTSYIKTKCTSPTFASQLDEALGLWDDLMECFYRFNGMDGVDENFPMPSFPERVVMDVHLENERFSYVNSKTYELLESADMIDMVTNPERIKSGDITNLLGWMENNNYLSSTYATSQASTLWSTSYSKAFLCIPYVWFLQKNNWMNGRTQAVSSYTISTIANYKPADSRQLSIGYTWDLGNAAKSVMEYVAADTCKLYSTNLSINGVSSGTSASNCAAILLFMQIGNYVGSDAKTGWGFWAHFNRTRATLSLSDMNYLAYQLSAYFKRDFTMFFSWWGIELNDNVRLATSVYPPMEWQQWNYNPVSGNVVSSYDGSSPYTQSGKVPYHTDRSKWVAFAYSGVNMEPDNYYISQAKGANPDTYKPASLFDGSRTTFWISQSDEYKKYTDAASQTVYPYKDAEIYKKATTPQFPYYIVIKPGDEASAADGFYIANGNTEEKFLYEVNKEAFSYAPQHIIVEITNDELVYEETDLPDFGNTRNIRWTTIYDSDNDPNHLHFHPDRKNLFYVDFGNHYSFKGMRLTFDRPTHYAKDKPTDWDDVAYPNRPETNHQLDRIHKLAEFGTYYYK